MKILLSFFIAVFGAFPLFAGPTAEGVCRGLHATIDTGTVYVWNEAGKAIDYASKAAVEAVEDGVDWYIAHKDEAARTVVLVVGKTVEEAKDFWDAYGGTIGDTLLVVADVAVDGAREAYAFGKGFFADSVTYYERHKDEMHDKLQSALRAAKPYVDDGIVFVKDSTDYLAGAAAEAFSRGEKYYQTHKEEIHAGVRTAVLWSQDRVDELNDLARDKWVPSGRKLLGEAAAYYEKEVGPKAEELGRRVVAAASDSAGRVIEKGKELAEEYHEVPAGVAMYLGDVGQSLLSYAGKQGSDLVSQTGPVLDQAKESLGSAAGKAAQAIQPALGRTAEAVQDGASALAKSAANAVQNAAPMVQRTMNEVQGSAQRTYDAASRAVSSAVSGAASALGGLFGGRR